MLNFQEGSGRCAVERTVMVQGGRKSGGESEADQLQMVEPQNTERKAHGSSSEG